MEISHQLRDKKEINKQDDRQQQRAHRQQRSGRETRILLSEKMNSYYLSHAYL
jgi:hypothetical protein